MGYRTRDTVELLGQPSAVAARPMGPRGQGAGFGSEQAKRVAAGGEWGKRVAAGREWAKRVAAGGEWAKRVAAGREWAKRVAAGLAPRCPTKEGRAAITGCRQTTGRVV